jgi:hypothetical protein
MSSPNDTAARTVQNFKTAIITVHKKVRARTSEINGKTENLTKKYKI